MDASVPIPVWTDAPIERTNARHRHRYCEPFKACIVEHALKLVMSAAGLAMRNQFNANQLRRWMSLHRSRYTPGGSIASWTSARRLVSRVATGASRGLLGVRLTDPMSGFFMLSPRLLRATAGRLSGRGFKLLLDLVVAAPRSLRLAELPYRFEARRHGGSKLDAGVYWAFAAFAAFAAFVAFVAFVARKSMQRGRLAIPRA